MAVPERNVRTVSVVIPARNEQERIGQVVRAVRRQRPHAMRLETIVVDDGSTDATAARARQAGATVIGGAGSQGHGSPAAARNVGARVSSGDPIVFLDADCVPQEGWLAAILSAHDAGEIVVGGALALPPGLPPTARCDYYCGWYLTHPGRKPGHVPHHPPPNLSVRRVPFLATSGFSERAPLEYTNEERGWQNELRQSGHRIRFEPAAAVWHYNRPGFLNLMRRNYRWAYTALEAKSESGAARMAWLYRYPRLLIAAALPLAIVHTFFIIACWARAGVFEPVVMSPLILASRFAYMTGMSVGGIRWLRHGQGSVAHFGRMAWRK